MRLRETALVCMLTCNMMIALSTPLWWDYAQPYIFNAPEHIQSFIKTLAESLGYLIQEITEP